MFKKLVDYVANVLHKKIKKIEEQEEKEKLFNFWNRLSKDPYQIFPKSGERVYKGSSDKWSESTNDENGNILSYKDSDGFWEKYEYDENNNLLMFENSDGCWQKNTYDSFNNLLTHENSDKYLITNTYNEDGNLLSSLDSLGIWTKINYYPNGFIKCYNDSLSKNQIKIECPVVKHYNNDGSAKTTEANDCACAVCQDKLEE